MNKERINQPAETTAKPKLSKKKLLIILVAVVAVLAIVAVILLSNNSGSYKGPMYNNKEEVYTYFNAAPHDTLCYDMTQYKDTIAKENGEQFSSSNSSSLDDAIRNSVPLSDTYSDTIKKGNQMISSFFAETYGISVDAELAELSVHHADLGDIAGGAFALPFEGTTDGKTVVINDTKLENFDNYTTAEEQKVWEQLFFEIYLHETIHYLGSCNGDYDSVGWTEFIEGVTQALTIAVLDHGGYEPRNESLYIYNTALAQQLLVADQSFLVFLIEGEGYRSSADIEEWFDAKSFDGFGDAFQDSVALTSLFENKKEYQKIAQHLMGEFLKRYDDLTEAQMVEIADHFIAPISVITK